MSSKKVVSRGRKKREVIVEEGRGKRRAVRQRPRTPREERVTYRDHMRVVLDEKLREAVRAAAAFMEVVGLLRGQCGLADVNLKLVRAEVERSMTKTATLGQVEVLEIVERMRHLGDALSVYSRLHGRFVNRLGDLRGHVGKISDDWGEGLAAKDVRECLVGFHGEADWWLKAANVVLREWSLRDERFMNIVKVIGVDVNTGEVI